MRASVGFFGASGTGKSLAVRTLLNSPTDERLLPTAAASCHMVPKVLVDCKDYSVSLWDTSGNRRYFVIIHAYMSSTHIHVFFYNLSAEDQYFFDVYNESEKSGPRLRLVVGTHLSGPVNEEVRARIVQWTQEKGLPYLDVDVFDDSSMHDVLIEALQRLE